jgi:hypothetical protein
VRDGATGLEPATSGVTVPRHGLGDTTGDRLLLKGRVADIADPADAPRRVVENGVRARPDGRCRARKALKSTERQVKVKQRVAPQLERFC